jgi:hypothetical protein
MKNITLSADEQLIEQARLLAKSRHKTLNILFREWLEQFTAQSGGAQEFDRKSPPFVKNAKDGAPLS